MNIAIKIFLTYAAISMFSALMYVFVYGSIVGVGHLNLGIFLLLWLGPLASAFSIGGPILLWRLWTEL